MDYKHYLHHGWNVTVRSDLKGKHREHCLCFQCARFHPGPPEKTCSRANLLYAVCVQTGMVTPVYECPKFEPKEGVDHAET